MSTQDPTEPEGEISDVVDESAPAQAPVEEPADEPTNVEVTPPAPPGAYGQIPQPGTTPTGEEYVPWSGRVAAYLIDAAPAVVVALLASWFKSATGTEVTEVVAQVGGQDITAQVTQASTIGTIVQILATIAILVYWFWNKGYREGKTGKSIGKQILNYTTYDEASHLPIGAKSGCIRAVLLWVDFAICYIGVLWPLWDVKKQTFLSDRFTSAIVLKD